jgi:cytochrome b561
VAWRVVNVAPSLPADIPSLECRLSRASHLLLYLLLFLMPITGWVVHSAANIPFRMFWLIPVPAIVAPDKAMSDLAARAHYAIFIVLSVLLAVHIGAALRHHYRKRNQVFVRMLPGR